MERIALGLLVFITIVSIAGLISLDSNTGLANGILPPPLVTLKGSIADKDGYPLWSRQTQTQLLTSIVATNSEGRVLGYGPLESVFYTLYLYERWEGEGTIFIKIGYYDAYRPERTKLQECTSISSNALREAIRSKQRFVSWDLTCDQFESRVSGRMRAYY